MKYVPGTLQKSLLFCLLPKKKKKNPLWALVLNIVSQLIEPIAGEKVTGALLKGCTLSRSFEVAMPKALL